MSDHQTQLGPGQIQFHQWCEPPLESGQYTVEVTHSVAELDAKDANAFSNKFSFSVAGPRFSLDPSEIYCVYPPKNHSGDFANSLPHIVFTRRTLPWERTIYPGPRKKDDKLPWMALLVLSAADFLPERAFPEVKLRNVGGLINAKPGDIFVGPRLGLDAYQKESDLCSTLDLPWDLFRSVAPSVADLGYLAHVREVNTGNKETLSFLADGWFSVVAANRFPEPEQKGAVQPLEIENRAYLVSLEGVQDYLPLPGSAATAGDKKPVRLAVLANWSFRCRMAFGFKASMNKLKVGRLAVPDFGDAAKTDAEKRVSIAYNMGYTALNHSTRLGEKAVSWYRGPLVPLDLKKQSKFIFRPAADAALRYSPLDGMMDVSYAAAFQLGRLLALQDRHFAMALYAYRSGVQRQINEVLGRKRVMSVFSGAPGDHESGIMTSYLAKLGPAKGAQVASTGWAVEQPAIRFRESESKPNALNLTTDFQLTIPQSVCRWLARLVLLYRVPFTYLVADERMLPPDSMRFFYLDPSWIKCLLEGACSVGRSSSRDELVDEYLRDKFLDFAMEQALEVRTRTPEAGAGSPRLIASNSAENPTVVTTPDSHGLSTNDRIVISGVSSSEADINGTRTVTVIDAKSFSVPVDSRKHAGAGGSFVRDTSVIAVQRKPGPAALPNWPLTGFLLRSPAVEGWQGLEMRASGVDGQGNHIDPLQPLRIDRLSPDIMLCIFNGTVNRIEVKQPPEGMHFGATVDGESFQKPHLRRLNNGSKYDAEDKVPPGPGHQLNDDSNIPIPLRKDRVVDVSATAEKLKERLEEMEARDPKTDFTSADFGVEMVESPGRVVVFDVTNEEGAAK